MADYYIHGKIGDNSAAGTSVDVPWKTLTKALTTYAEGDILWLKGGYEYTVSAPVTLKKSVVIKPWLTDRPSGEPIITWDEAGANCFEIIPEAGNGASYEFRNIIFKKYDGTAIASIYVKPDNKVITVTVYSCIFTGNINPNYEGVTSDIRYGIHRPDTDAVGITSVIKVWYCTFLGLTKGYWGFEKHKDLNSLIHNIFSSCGNQAKDVNAAVSIERSVHGTTNAVVSILQRNYFHDCEQYAIYKTWLTHPTTLAYFGTWTANTNISNYYPSVVHAARLQSHTWNSVAATQDGWTIPAGWTHVHSGDSEKLTLATSDAILYQDFNDIEATSMLYKIKDNYLYKIGNTVVTPPDAGYLEVILADNPTGTSGVTLTKIRDNWTAEDELASPPTDITQLAHIYTDYLKKSSHRYLVFKPSQVMSCVIANLGIWQVINHSYPFRDVEALDFRWPLRIDEAPLDGIAYSDDMNTGPYGAQAITDGKVLTGTEYTLSMVNSLVQPFEHRQFAGYDVDWEDEYTSWEDLSTAMEMSGGAWFKTIKYSRYDAFDVGVDEASNYFVTWNDADTDHSYTDINDKSTVLELDGVTNVVDYTSYPKAYIVSYGSIPGWYNLSGTNNSENKYGGQSKKMTAGLHDITIEQGSNFKRTFTWKDSNAAPVNVTGYTAKLNIKGKKSDTSALYSTDQAGHIALGGTAGTITINVPAATTGALDFNWGVWDIELTDGSSNVTRLLEGKVKLSKQVTTV